MCQIAMKLLRQSAFDVVASDMQMPGMSGIELLSEVRKLLPQTSRIIISGVADRLDDWRDTAAELAMEPGA